MGFAGFRVEGFVEARWHDELKASNYTATPGAKTLLAGTNPRDVAWRLGNQGRQFRAVGPESRQSSTLYSPNALDRERELPKAPSPKAHHLHTTQF